jgi:hypothetical protein
MSSGRACLTALIAATMGAMALSAGAATSAASPSSAPPQGESWASIAKLPDWGGVWEPVFGPRSNGPPQEPASFTPEYAAKLQAFKDEEARGAHQDAPTANCVPPGMPGIMSQPYPIEFLITPGKVTVVIEAYSQTRRIFTDARKHPADPDVTFNGHSIGHWEGDTLVVDTVGVTTDNAIGASWGMKHSAQMRIEERIRATGPDTMEIRTTLIDPVALTKPWTTTRIYGRHRDWDIAEYVCEQNNRNFVNPDGKAGIILNH